MARERESEIKRLRSQAGRIGITIRSQRAPRDGEVRAYSLIDTHTGSVIHADIQGLVDLQARLWWIVRDRRSELTNGRRAISTSTESCPSCGTPRVGQFRWCRSCGLDYEAKAHRPTADVVGRADQVILPPPPRLSQLVAPPGRFGALRDAFSPSHHFSSWRELGIAAIIGLVIGILVAVLGGSR